MIACRFVPMDQADIDYGALHEAVRLFMPPPVGTAFASSTLAEGGAWQAARLSGTAPSLAE